MSKNINLTITAGATYQLTIDLSSAVGNINFSTYTPTAAIRKHYESANTVAVFSCSTTANSMVMTLSANTVLPTQKLVWDAKLVGPGGDVIRPTRGLVYVLPSVTP